MTSDVSTVHLANGDRIYTAAQMDDLPIGTVICETSNTSVEWTKNDDGVWYAADGRRSGTYASTQFSMDGYNRVKMRPGDPPSEPPPPTLRQFQWKFRENALAGGRENGIATDTVTQGLTRMGIPEEWELGPGVDISVYDETLTLPDGLVVMNRPHVDPKSERYALFLRKRHVWLPLLNRRYGMSNDVRIAQFPGVEETPAWWSEVGTEESLQEVAEFKATAWRIGYRIKQDHSWCGTFEHVIARVGVTRKCLDDARHSGFAIGDRVNQDSAARLPNHTLFVFRASDDATRWAIYQRDDNANNLTRTRRIAGDRGVSTRPLGNYATGMTVLTVPEAGAEGPSYEIAQDRTVEVIDLLPAGSRFMYSGTQYMIARDRKVRGYTRRMDGQIPETGTYEPSVFHTYGITINHLEESA